MIKLQKIEIIMLKSVIWLLTNFLNKNVKFLLLVGWQPKCFLLDYFWRRISVFFNSIGSLFIHWVLSINSVLSVNSVLCINSFIINCWLFFSLVVVKAELTMQYNISVVSCFIFQKHFLSPFIYKNPQVLHHLPCSRLVEAWEAFFYSWPYFLHKSCDFLYFNFTH